MYRTDLHQISGLGAHNDLTFFSIAEGTLPWQPILDYIGDICIRHLYFVALVFQNADARK